MNVTIYRVSTNSVGIGQSQDDGTLAVIRTAGQDVVSVTLQHVSGTTGTWAAKMRYSNSPNGPWADYATPVALSGSALGSGLCAVLGDYTTLDVTTAAGGESIYNVSFSTRTSPQRSTQIGV